MAGEDLLILRKYSELTQLDFFALEGNFRLHRKYSNLDVLDFGVFEANFKLHRKYSDLIILEDFTVNLPPNVDNPIADQEVIEGNLFDFQVPSDTFSDPEAQALVLTATLENDDALPSWLTFSTITETFTGIPSHIDIGNLQIKVTATDPDTNSVFDVFQLTVNEDLIIKTRDLLKAFRTLLPDGRAWNIDLSDVFKKLIDAIMDTAADVKEYFLRIPNDVFPDSTKSLELWEEQFLLDASGLTESERRSNVTTKWSGRGGQSVNYIETILLTLGIVAKVYENFNRDDPNDFLVGGDSELLVNGSIISESKKYVNTCGNPAVTCGSDATAGEYSSFITEEKLYAIGIDPEFYIHYFIIADPASVFTPLDVPAGLERAFKLAVLRIKPTHTRVILNVNYI